MDSFSSKIVNQKSCPNQDPSSTLQILHISQHLDQLHCLSLLFLKISSEQLNYGMPKSPQIYFSGNDRLEKWRKNLQLLGIDLLVFVSFCSGLRSFCVILHLCSLGVCLNVPMENLAEPISLRLWNFTFFGIFFLGLWKNPSFFYLVLCWSVVLSLRHLMEYHMNASPWMDRERTSCTFLFASAAVGILVSAFVMALII